MKIFPSALLLACAAAATPQALADCRDIVASTVAEMRAGAAEWNDDMERLARAAAGSACVKAGGDAAPAQIREQAVRAEGAAQQAPAQAAAEASAEESGASDKQEESWSPFKDIKFNEVTASPNKKPYERRRSVNEADKPED